MDNLLYSLSTEAVVASLYYLWTEAESLKMEKQVFTEKYIC